MGTDKKTQIRIIKQGMAGSIPESKAVSEERQKGCDGRLDLQRLRVGGRV